MNVLHSTHLNAHQTHPVSGMRGASLSIHDFRVFYYMQLHETIMNAWQSFRENLKDIREQGDVSYRFRTLEASRRIGEQRRAESLKFELGESLPLHTGRSHQAKRRFHEGIFIGEHLSHAQLNLPV